jgi:hypothetical protein
VKYQIGDAGADAALDDAVKLVTPQTDFPTRFLEQIPVVFTRSLHA